MRIGIPSEVKQGEWRVAATPTLVAGLAAAGHEVWVQSGAGAAVGYSDAAYREAKIVASAEEVWSADLVVKVKEPQPEEYGFLREGLILFGFLHLAACAELEQVLLERKVKAIPFEMVADGEGNYPLLAPMSEIAGRVAAQSAAVALYKENGGRGVLLPAMGSVAAQKAVVIGGGVVGTAAAKSLMGLGARVSVLDLKNFPDLPGIVTRVSSPEVVAEEVADALIVVGAVLVPGCRAPVVITEKMVEGMLPGAVIADVAIDQGGCCATSRPTTHAEPTYLQHGVVHYCVTNIPAACARTATEVLSAAVEPYLLELAQD